MARWVGFLRAVNVGGRTVPTDDLRQVLSATGLADVGSYLASGNIFFTHRSRTRERLAATIEAALADRFGFEVPTLLRTTEELNACLEAAPFDAKKPEGDVRRLVVFVRPDVVIDHLPLELPRGAGVIHGSTGGELFVEMVVGGRVPNPVASIERDFGTVATGRFLHTLHKIAAAANAGG